MGSLADRIRHRREELGLGVADVSKLSGLPESRVTEVEGGSPASTFELARLADAVAADPAALLQGVGDDPKRSSARFRAPGGVTDIAPLDVRLLARAQEAGRVCAELRKMLGEEPSPIARLRRVRFVGDRGPPWRQGYELGLAARSALAPTSEALDSVQALLEAQCIHVAFVPFSTKGIEAASLFESSACPVILLNKAAKRVKYPLSRRAILAHELCHLLHDGGQNDLLTLVSRTDDESPVEQRANGFAPSFIAPGKWVKKGPHTSASGIVSDLAREWGLSFEGAAWHAKNLRKITADDAERLISAPRRPNLDGSFEREIARTPPSQFGVEAEPTALVAGHLAERIIMACAEGVISKGRAAELLSLS
ncbi:MAG: helix-turn-helix domain-containing protein [Deltaproteobacteria bacterium]|nr:helix-turn-helix domain-containing protein [Deltaproteobacteria bacterium]